MVIVGDSQESLGGTDCLRPDPVAHLGAQPPTRYEVHFTAQQGLEPVLDVKQVEVADGSVELDQEVDIALRASLVARKGAEDREGPHAQRAQLPLVAPR